MTTWTWRPSRLVLVGSVIGDMMMRVPRLPVRGGDVLASASVLQAGGGYNVPVAARRLDLPCALAGRVGTGPIGDVIAAALAGDGIDALLPRTTDDSGFTVGFVEPDGERTFVTSPGTEAELTSAELNSLRVADDDAVYVSGYDLCYPQSGPAIAAWITARSCSVILDPGPLADQIPDAILTQVLNHTRILTMNAREAGLLHVDSRPGMLVIVRDGPRGCQLSGAGYDGLAIAAPEVKAIDTTGAGDAHTGALLAELSRTGDPAAAARLANVAAAIAVTEEGSATGPDRHQIDAFLASQPAG